MTLSITGLASALGTELARSAPLQAPATIAPQALAASSSLPTTALLANTVQTMSTFKSTSITAAAVLALFAIPISQQLAEGSRIRAEMRAAADSQGTETSSSSSSKSMGRGGTGRTGTGMIPSRTAGGILASLDGPADNHAMIRALLEGESLENTMVRSRITMMSPDEFKQLLDDLQSFPCADGSKDLLASSIQRYGPELHPRDRLERIVATGRSSATDRPMKDWAKSEPEAALTWYRERRASGELDPGLNDELHRTIITSLVRGMATSSPEAAFNFYREMPREEMSSSIVRWLASDFATSVMETGDETLFLKMLEYHGKEGQKEVLVGTFGEFAKNGQYDAGLALVDKYNPDPAQRTDYIGRMFSDGLNHSQLQDGLDWLGQAMTAAETPEVVGRVIAGYFSGRRSEASEWLDRQSPGALRDHGYAGLVESRLDVRQFEEALSNAEQIDDAALRAASQQMIGQQWLKHDREKAEQGLPTELLERLRSQ